MVRERKKPLYGKRKSRKRVHGHIGKSMQEGKHTATEREVSELTLKRLHTLGSQKFGSSPFSLHFDRWLMNVTAVLSEFESHLTINVDDQFVRERSQTLSTIKLQLEDNRRKEASLNQEIRNLSNCRSRLEQINTEYVGISRAIKRRKSGEIKRLYSSIDRLKRDLEMVIRMKTGFFRGVSRKDREQKEMEIVQELSDKQRELELVMLSFGAEQKELRAEYERKREPVMEQIKNFRKIMRNTETDDSLEERWFACEALIDAINTFLQRKAAQPH
jgi:hypothetical protein